ncbi:MAG: lysophospholipid acyltransferase family protein [Deltaproteobacteria bacterium]|nr:lysophospholipid acyltransferase family protein [Deltaproteobacteria bacterium]
MWKRLKTFLMITIFPPLVYLFLWFLRITSCVVHINRECALEAWSKGNLIVCFWHGRLLMMPFAYERKKGKVIISRHRDGEFIARVMRYFNLASIRGSYRKGGIGTSREVLRSLKEGYDIAITPDGPKGPRYLVKKGVLEIARLSGRPIIPVSYSASKKKDLTLGMNLSFHFLFPKFFSSGVIL